MAHLSPIISQSPSKENDLIGVGSSGLTAAVVAAKDDDEFEDSLNASSISEHISEEIESANNNLSSTAEDSIDRPIRRFDQMVIDKQRKLFDFDDNDDKNANEDDDVAESATRRFKKFDINNSDLDRLLSGDNIAQHFIVETTEAAGSVPLNTTSTSHDDAERSEKSISHRGNSFDTKIDVIKSVSNDGAVASAGNSNSVQNVTPLLAKELENVDEIEKSAEMSKSKRTNESATGSAEIKGDDDALDSNDVILINDHEISLTSLKKLQQQRPATDSRHSDQQTNQNTTSDISDLLNEDVAKEREKSIDDISAILSNESRPASGKSENRSNTVVKSDREQSITPLIDERSKSDSAAKSNNSNSDQSTSIEQVGDDDGGLHKCNPITPISPPELSMIEEISVDQNISSQENKSNKKLVESDAEKQTEIRKIIDEAVVRLPLEKENRSPNFLRDETRSIDSKCLASSQNSTTTDGTVFNAMSRVFGDAAFECEININLVHMQNKIRELQNLNAGKYAINSLTNFPLDLPISSSSRRNSLKDSLKDFPQSGRDSTSITTNSTEYKTFQEEYFRLTDLQVALSERDKIIQELTDSLKQSIDIRDQLNERNERLTNEAKQLRAITAAGARNKWQSVENAAEAIGQRLSETTIDLVSESEYDDDEYYSKKPLATVEQEKSIEAQTNEQQQPTELIKFVPQTTIEEFQKTLSADEIPLFAQLQEKFDKLLHQELHELRQQLRQEQMEKSENDAEINRLRQMLAKIKCGSTEVKELRTELDKIHKKEMEDLRMYFEQKCTDLEKQYSEEVFSQHSRRHSNDTNSDLSDAEVFLPDDTATGIRRKSKAGEILASPTHRKITPTNIRSTGSSPSKRSTKAHANDSKSSSSASGSKAQNPPTDGLHEFYRKQIADLKHTYDDTIKHLQYKLQTYENRQADDEYLLTKPSIPSSSTTVQQMLLTNDKLKNINENNEMFNNLVMEYDRRLEEQVKLAKADMLNELEIQIKTLLSESAPEESRWPPELILLREKFTAKTQLEIAQLQIKHEEEMSRMKIEHQKQLNRKIKRHSNFDDGRDLEKCELERDNLRELCNTFRHLLYELAKCVSVCDSNLNASLVGELNKYDILQTAGVNVPASTNSLSRPNSPIASEPIDLNQSTCSSIGNRSMRVALVPDVSGILTLIEDPSLVNFVAEKLGFGDEDVTSSTGSNFFNLNDCLEKLKMEADSLLQLSEKLLQKKIVDNKEFVDKNDSIEEEDGLKSKKSVNLSYSLNNFASKDKLNTENGHQKQQRLSLPISLPLDNTLGDLNRKILSQSDVNELKNRLVVAERKNLDLEKELIISVAQQNELSEALRIATIKLNGYLDGHSEELSEGYGISQLRSPQRQPASKIVTNFSALQERAKQYFNDTNSTDNVAQLLQLIEDFCREGDKLIEEEKHIKKDLQEQIVAAENQRKEDLKFMEEQAQERELERDEFQKEIEQLKAKLRDKDKERLTFDSIAKESESLEQQLHEMAATMDTYKSKNSELQKQLIESINKIQDLRDIITELEMRINKKNTKLQALESYMNDQTTVNESLQHEMESLISQTETTTPAYEAKIKQLEEQIQSLQPNAEQSAAIERIAGHLRDIEDNLDRKTHLLESIHVMTGSVTSCSSPSEDVSIRGSGNNLDGAILSPRNFKYLAKDPSFPVDQILRIMEKLQKHNKVEEAAIKRVQDLEMQIKALQNSYVELQSERDLLQEKMSEQILRISSIQSRLDEQRQRAEELQRVGTSDLNLKVYDLQAELAAVKETLSARDKQITVLKSHLAQSKEIIDKQEAEIALCSSGGGGAGIDKGLLEKLEAQIASKELENKQLKDKIRTEMITKVALPDLMETMLADKTDEIDYLKEQLDSREKELKAMRDRQMFTKAEEKISSLFSRDVSASADYLDNDYARKEPEAIQSGLTGLTTNFAIDPAKFFANNETTLEPAAIPQCEQTPPLRPRQINFTSKSTLGTNTKQNPNTPPPISQNPSTIEIQSNIKHEECEQIQMQLENELKILKLSRNDKIQTIDTLTKEKTELKRDLDAGKIKLSKDIDVLRDEIDKVKTKVKSTEEELALATQKYDKKCTECDTVNTQLIEARANNEVIQQQLNSMSNTIQLKDELISKFEKNLYNYAQNENEHLETINRLQQENNHLLESAKDVKNQEAKQMLQLEYERLKEVLADTERELAEKMIGFEKCLLDIAEHEKTIYHLNDVLTDSKSARSVEELRIEIRNYREQNELLKQEIELLKHRLERSEHLNSPLPKPIDEIAIDEITSAVEKELNYSAQLDSNIMKAIESDEMISDHENNFDEVRREEREQFETELGTVRAHCKTLEKTIETLQQTLNNERTKLASIREQDASCIETMTKRLEAALEQESELNQLLDEERARTSQLSTKILEHQFEWSKLSASNLSLNESSPRRIQKGTDLDQELVKRQNDEIKLLKSQNEREKERALDMEKALLREKSRFEKELSDQKAYGDSVKDELDRIIRENHSLQEELDNAQDRFTISSREIDNLQSRIKNLQETESYRAARQEKERNQSVQNATTCQDLKSKLIAVERERDVLRERVSILQNDIERGAQREARLTESLTNVAGYSLQNQQQNNFNGNGLVPQQLLSKLKEMNDNLSENVRENRQLSETLQFLTDERQALQKKVLELEQGCIDRDELEERANHLFGKYLRTESFRRALVHQKRYLMIVLGTYECNEAKVLSLVNNNMIMPKRRKVPSFKSVVLVAIAIERMKFILRRWHTGKRVCAKGILLHNTPPRRTHSASTINWARSDSQVPNVLYHPQSPPSRDRPSTTTILKGRRSAANNEFTPNQI